MAAGPPPPPPPPPCVCAHDDGNHFSDAEASESETSSGYPGNHFRPQFDENEGDVPSCAMPWAYGLPPPEPPEAFCDVPECSGPDPRDVLFDEDMDCEQRGLSDIVEGVVGLGLLSLLLGGWWLAISAFNTRRLNAGTNTHFYTLLVYSKNAAMERFGRVWDTFGAATSSLFVSLPVQAGTS
eukprot:TRINITY_DN7377_c0_g1_i1.p1 TRINITY_DN7377_c0_g1~~TRINITY_DN7377_c0_g1_i1.p1  ORF type:complete len:182 (+),score=25.97 TRINITY_DN7377_c0_g1_i1:227-772(+)